MIDVKALEKCNLPALDSYLKSVPYNVTQNRLYSPTDLFDKFDPDNLDSFQNCYDTVVYNHVVKTGKQSNCHYEVLARSLHDCCVNVCLHDFLSDYDKRHVVGIMGGHAMLRTEPSYYQTVMVSKKLTELGYLMISGGGPGAMEATHLGAWLAERHDNEVVDALRLLEGNPCFQSAGWLSSAFELKEKYPRVTKRESLAIPTWFYGHEPPCAFATKIAKFFDNSVREDTILTQAYGGLIYMPGSAGTLQEIFQEAVQDHYKSFGFASPMIFVGSKFWNEEVPAVPFISQLIASGHYKNLIVKIADTSEEIISAVNEFCSSTE